MGKMWGGSLAGPRFSVSGLARELGVASAEVLELLRELLDLARGLQAVPALGLQPRLEGVD